MQSRGVEIFLPGFLAIFPSFRRCDRGQGFRLGVGIRAPHHSLVGGQSVVSTGPGQVVKGVRAGAGVVSRLPAHNLLRSHSPCQARQTQRTWMRVGSAALHPGSGNSNVTLYCSSTTAARVPTWVGLHHEKTSLLIFSRILRWLIGINRKAFQSYYVAPTVNRKTRIKQCAN